MDDLIHILRDRVELKRRGNTLVGCCPFHSEKTPSFYVYQDQHYHCYSCGAHGLVSSLTRKSLPKFEHVAKPPKEYPALDWTPFREAMQAKHIARLVRWRGYSAGFCEWLRDKGHIGVYQNQFCFPIYHGGKICRAHIRRDERDAKGWFYYPTTGCRASAFVIRNGTNGDTHIFESQWDMFAAMFQIRQGLFIATRGAANARKLAAIASITGKPYAYPQNDKAGEKWLVGVSDLFPNVLTIRVPGKDVNDFCKKGGKIKTIK